MGVKVSIIDEFIIEEEDLQIKCSFWIILFILCTDLSKWSSIFLLSISTNLSCNLGIVVFTKSSVYSFSTESLLTYITLPFSIELK